jgi:L-lactate dehydrogenase complex protein LldE
MANNLVSDQVYLFGTCLIDTFYPEAGMDAIALLGLCGQQVIFPQAQTCCGQPPYNSGENKAARDVARQTIQCFSHKKIPLIVPSASCAGMIKYHYPSLFKPGSPEHEQAIELSARTYELVEYIEPLLPYDQQITASPAHITLHRSCCALREMQVATHWLSILDKLDHVTVSLPEQEAECCGFGGTFAIKSPAISAAMTEDKCRYLLASKPEEIVSGDCGCLMNISGHLQHNKTTTPTQHLARFVAKRFGVEHV